MNKRMRKKRLKQVFDDKTVREIERRLHTLHMCCTLGIQPEILLPPIPFKEAVQLTRRCGKYYSTMTAVLACGLNE